MSANHLPAENASVKSKESTKSIRAHSSVHWWPVSPAFVPALAIAMCLASCVSAQNKKDLSMPLYRAPTNAVMPDGVSEIKMGMNQAEVHRILGHRYSGFTTSGPIHPYSVVDVFEYSENGTPMHIEIWYADNQVAEIKYGYDQSKGIE